MSYVLATDEPQENGEAVNVVPLTVENVARDLTNPDNWTVNWKGIAVAGAALGGMGLLYYYFFREGGREKVNQYMRELALRS